MSNILTIIYALRRELTPGVFTVAMCGRCRIHAARGGGVCALCLRDELAEVVGEALATNYYDAVREESQLRERLELMAREPESNV